jgi:hypothetical protein
MPRPVPRKSVLKRIDDLERDVETLKRYAKPPVEVGTGGPGGGREGEHVVGHGGLWINDRGTWKFIPVP